MIDYVEDEDTSNYQRISAHDYVKMLREEYGMPEEDDDPDPDEDNTSWRSNFNSVPTFYVTTKEREDNPKVSTNVPKWYKREQKIMEKAKKKKLKQEQYDRAYWFLNTWCEPWFADDLYAMYPDVDDLVQFCCEYYEGWVTYCTHDEDRFLTNEELVEYMEEKKEEEESHIVDVGGMKFRPLTERYKHKKEYDIEDDTTPDIPAKYWKQFKKYCKKHPLDKPSDLYPRRVKFLKKINRRNKKFRKNMMLLDPYTGLSMMSEKKMVKRLNQIVEENKQRTKNFTEFLKDMVDKGYMTKDTMAEFVDKSSSVIDYARGRLEEAKEAKKRWDKEREREERRRQDYYRRRDKWFKANGNLDDWYEPEVEMIFKDEE